jgi:hypothetical protein
MYTDMKRFLKTIVLVAACAFMVTSCYDDSALKTSINDLKKQLSEMSAVVNDLKSGKVITNVTPTDKGYTFTMSDGKNIDILNGKPGEDGTPASVIETKIWDGVVAFSLGETVKVLTNVTGVEVVDAFAPAGWTAVEEDGSLTVTAPNRIGDAARKGTVIVVATSGNSLVLMTAAVALNILDVNGAYWDALIDSPMYGGDLLYGDPDEYYCYHATYTWEDAVTKLAFGGFGSYWGSVCFSSGGEAISNYVEPDFKDADYLRQLEVPAYPATGRNFIVHYGGEDTQSGLSFSDGKARTIQSIDYIITNYMANSAIYGDGYFGPLSGESFLAVKATGFDAKGNETATLSTTIINGSDVASYLAGTKSLTWEKWDLSGLGEVVSVKFAVYGSEDCYGEWGFNAPAYFAYCDVVVKD